MSKKYIILGNNYGWCKFTHALAEKTDNVEYIDDYLPVRGSLKKKLVHLHYSSSLNKHFSLPLKKMWYGTFYKTIGLKDNSNDVLIIYDNNKLCNDVAFLTAIRKRFPKITLVYMFTNIIAKSRAIDNDFVGELKKYYDIVFAFDRVDAEKYDFSYSPLVYSPDVTIRTATSSKEDNVFYIGNAKDRVDMLHSAFERLMSIGMKCNFFIVGVPEDKQIHKESITYNTTLPYDVVLDHIQDSTCLLDVIQGDSTGLTIKVCEAVYFNKKLITTNKDVMNYDFYDERFIEVIDSADDISERFLNENQKVEYKESGREYFSLNALINRINEITDSRS